MISIKNVSKICLNTKMKDPTNVIVLDDISLDLPSTGFVSVIGPSVSGKTALLDLIGGLDCPTEGDIFFENQNYSSFNLDNFRSTNVGFFFPNHDLFIYETVEYNFRTALDIRHKKYDREEAVSVLKKVDLSEDYLVRKVRDLTNEQKLRISIARALIKDSKIILADECTSALDDETDDLIFRLLKKISADRLVVLASRDRELTDRYSDRIIELNDGKVTKDLVKNPTTDTESSETGNLSKKHKVFSLARKIRFSFSRPGYKWFRLFMSILLGMISLSCFSVIFKPNDFEVISSQTEILMEHDVRFAFLRPDSTYRSPARNKKIDYPYFTDTQLSAIGEYNGFSTVYRGDTDTSITDSFNKNLNLDRTVSWSDNLTKWERRSVNLCYSCLKLDDSVTESDLAISKDSRFVDESGCSLPKAPDQIAISSLNYDAFEKFGYVDADGNVYSIETPDDMIGRYLGDFVIVGVYSTSEDDILRSEIESSDDTSYTTFINSTHMYDACFVTSDSLLKSYNNQTVFIRMDEKISSIKQLIKTLTYSEDYVEELYGKSYDTTLNASVEMYSSYDWFTDDLLTILSDVKLYLPYLSLIFAVVSVLLLISYQTAEFSSKMHDYGILISMGASKLDIFEISFIKLTFVTLVELILSSVAVIIFSAVFNHVNNLYLFSFTGIDFLILLAACIVLALIVALSTYLYMRKYKAVDFLRR